MTHSESLVAVLSALRLAQWEENGEPLTATEIARRVSFSREAVRWALRRLLALGKVERTNIAGNGVRGAYGWCLAEVK